MRPPEAGHVLPDWPAGLFPPGLGTARGRLTDRLLRRIGLSGERLDHIRRRIIAAVIIAWLPLVVLGVAVWVVGVVFETVGDAQLASYQRDPDRGPIMDRGLWGWTRHPNYFGDACVWWGIWLAGGAASGWLPAVVTVLSPLAMTYFIRNVTGAKLLEETMSTRPGWDEYAARVPLFVPRPPRRA